MPEVMDAIASRDGIIRPRVALAKAVSSALTLGSGGSGGIFAPSLFLGAAVGYALGLVLQKLGFFADISPATYALVGMTSVVAATTHVPITAIIIFLR